MDETKELLKASFERLEGLIGEVKELRFKIKDVQGDIDALRSMVGAQGQESEKDEKGQENHQGPGGSGKAEQRFTAIEERLDYLAQKFMELDQEIFRLKQKRR